MVRHTLKIVQHLQQDFKSMSDHFATLFIKAFKTMWLGNIACEPSCLTSLMSQSCSSLQAHQLKRLTPIRNCRLCIALSIGVSSLSSPTRGVLNDIPSWESWSWILSTIKLVPSTRSTCRPTTVKTWLSIKTFKLTSITLPWSFEVYKKLLIA